MGFCLESVDVGIEMGRVVWCKIGLLGCWLLCY